MTDFNMHTEAGNREIEKLLNFVKTRILRGSMARGNVIKFVSGWLDRITKEHDEARDSAVREEIANALNVMTVELHWERFAKEDF